MTDEKNKLKTMDQVVVLRIPFMGGKILSKNV